MSLWRQLAGVIAAIGVGVDFTADDVTDRGVVTVDAGHTPNGKQSAIGSVFVQAARQGLIVSTGRVVRSQSPHRKGGAIRVWTPTDAGVRWAHQELT